MTRDNNQKLRAVFLASLMFFWLFAGTMAFAGGAAATDANLEVDVTDIDPDNANEDATWTISHTLTVNEDEDHDTIDFIEVDFSDAEGIDVSQVNPEDIDIVVHGEVNPGGDFSIENVDEDSGVLDIDIDDPDYTNELDGAEIDLIISNINNPDQGDEYELVTELRDNGGDAIADGTGVTTYDITGGAISENRGFITGLIQDSTGDTPPNVGDTEITITRTAALNSEQDTDTVVVETTAAESGQQVDRYLEDVGVLEDQDETNFFVEASLPGFESFGGNVTVEAGETSTQDITLESNLQPAEFQVAAWDPETGQATGNATALLADGDIDNDAQLVVFAQSQIGTELSGEFEVTLTQDGDEPEVFVEDGETTDTTTVTLDGQNTTAASNVVGAYDSEELAEERLVDVDGDVSLAPVTVSAGDADEDSVPTVENVVVTGTVDTDPAAERQDDDFGTIGDVPGVDSTEETFQNTTLVTYFREGDKATQHDVQDTDATPIEGATVWAAYEGAPQDLEDVEDFQNEEGESFLVGETNENGDAVIPGLVADQQFNVYVEADNFNIFNSTEEDLNLEADTFIADYTLENTIEQDSDGSGERFVLSHTLRETPQDFNLDVFVENADGEFVKDARIPAGENRDVVVEVTAGEVGQDADEFNPVAGQEVEIDLTDQTQGQLNGAGDDSIEVSTDEDGFATATFESNELATGDTNVTANTTNADGDLYATFDDVGERNDINNQSDQARFNLFQAAELTGDVVDDENNNIRNATVTLTVEEGDEFVPVDETDVLPDDYPAVEVTGADGSFAYTNLPTNETYRVDGEFIDEDGEVFTGFAVAENIPPGTTNADIVIQGLVVDDGNNSDAELSDYQLEDGSTTTDLLQDAINDWRNDEISTDLLRQVIDNWRQSS